MKHTIVQTNGYVKAKIDPQNMNVNSIEEDEKFLFNTVVCSCRESEIKSRIKLWNK